MLEKNNKIFQQLLSESDTFPLKVTETDEALKACTSFDGIPRKYPGDSTVLVLYPDPFNDDRLFYEFAYDSIASVEELDTVMTESGKSLRKVRIWVRKGSYAVKSHTFTV